MSEQKENAVSLITNVIDKNIRIAQYSFCLLAAAGAVRMLHSVRAFSRFQRVEDIPKEFIRKNVRCRGRVRWVGTHPPYPKVPSREIEVNSGTYNESSSKISEPKGFTRNLGIIEQNKGTLAPSATTPSVSTSVKTTVSDVGGGDVKVDGVDASLSNMHTGKAFSQEKRTSVKDSNDLDDNAEGKGLLGLTKTGSGNFHEQKSTENLKEAGRWPDVKVVSDHDRKTRGLYLQVQHLPIIPLRRTAEEAPLLLKLAGIEITEAGSLVAKLELVNSKVWFTLLKHDEDTGALHCIVKQSKNYFLTYNSHLVRTGLANVEAFDTALKDSKTYAKYYKRIVRDLYAAQKYNCGMWKETAAAKPWWRRIFFWRK